jgi:hypothetical protein
MTSAPASKRARLPRALAASALAALACAGSARLYDGPARAPSEIAILEVAGTGAMVDTIDGENAKGYRFELLPGKHEVRFTSRTTVLISGGGGTLWSKLELRCGIEFVAAAGRSYRLDPRIDQTITHTGRDVYADPAVIELETRREFRGRCR